MYSRKNISEITKKPVIKKKTFKDKVKSGLFSLGQGVVNVSKTEGQNFVANIKSEAEMRRQENLFISNERAKLKRQEIKARLRQESKERISKMKTPTGGKFGDSLGGFDFGF